MREDRNRHTQRTGSRKKKARRSRAIPPLDARHFPTAPLGNDSDPGLSATSGSAGTVKRSLPTPTAHPPPAHVPLQASSSRAPHASPTPPHPHPFAQCIGAIPTRRRASTPSPIPFPPPHTSIEKRRAGRDEMTRGAYFAPSSRCPTRPDALPAAPQPSRRSAGGRSARQRAASPPSAQTPRPQQRPPWWWGGGGGTADATRVGGVAGTRGKSGTAWDRGGRGEECAVIGRRVRRRAAAEMRVSKTTSTAARGDGGVGASWQTDGFGCGGRAATSPARGEAAGRASATHARRAWPRRPGIGWRARVDLAGHHGGCFHHPFRVEVLARLSLIASHPGNFTRGAPVCGQEW